MNLLALKSEVLAHGFDQSQYGARIVQYLNDAQGLIARRVDYYIDEDSVQIITVPQAPYFALPADFARARSLMNMDLQRELEYTSLRDIDRSSLSNGVPTYYAQNGPGIQLYPIPDGQYNLLLRYWKLPAPLLADADTPGIPADWHRLLWEYAVQQCYEGDDDPTMGQYWKAKFQESLSMFAADVKFPSTDGPVQAKGMYDGQNNLGQRNSWGLYSG